MAKKLWLSDPVLFVAVVKQLWGKRSEELKYDIANLRAELDRMKPKTPQSYITSVELKATSLELPVVQLASLGQLAKIRKALEREQFEGKLNTKTLSATDKIKWINLLEESPHRAWITAAFYNDGTDTVYISINKDLDYVELQANDELPIDFSHADERIWFIYYKCAPGETASVRVVGKY